ncbi:Ger(x)C family spore germination protein [Vallitalea guaymasensis]|uniref:Ger(x)C family spore germination protein n=1 Tax=Vallitalea guaymasensis TaxID=1185412 RepID=UPI00187D30C5|nr:Ger(x)C family spore germination protein [Vallitalea guaymasensis]
MYKKIICIFLIPMLLITGCWDSNDINKKSINISLGVDYIDDNIQFYGELVKLTGSSTENIGKSQSASVYTVFAQGKTFEEARVDYNSTIPYRSFLGATRIVLFSEEFAKRGIESYLNRIDSLFDYRKTLYPVICRESMKEIFKIQTDKALAIGLFIENMLKTLNNERNSICLDVGDLLSIIAFGSEGYVIPYIGIDSNDLKYLGLAVFKESKLIDIIDVQDTEPLLYILADNTKLIELIPDPLDNQNKYSFRVHINKRKISTSLKDDIVNITVNLDLHAELRYQYYKHNISDEMIKQLETELSNKISNEIIDFVKEAQKNYKCDIFNFGKTFKAQHYYQYQKIDWEQAFLSANIYANVKTTIIDKNLNSDYNL